MPEFSACLIYLSLKHDGCWCSNSTSPIPISRAAKPLRASNRALLCCARREREGDGKGWMRMASGLGRAQTPERGDLGRTGRMQRVARVLRLAMARPRVQAPQHLQARVGDPLQQLRA